MRRIDWRHQSRNLLLPIAILPSANTDNPAELFRAEGLIDTGATATGIRSDIVRALSLRPKGRRRIFTANGDIIANEYLFRIGFFASPDDVAPYVIDREVLGFDLNENFSYPALIGMDILGCSDLTINRTGDASLTVY